MNQQPPSPAGGNGRTEPARGNYVRLSRSIRRSWLWSSPEFFYWWMDLQMSAAYTDTSVTVLGHTCHLRPGQLAGTLTYFQQRWNTGRRAARSFFDRLESEGLIAVDRRGNNLRIITLLSTDGVPTSQTLFDNDEVNNEEHNEKHNQNAFATEQCSTDVNNAEHNGEHTIEEGNKESKEEEGEAAVSTAAAATPFRISEEQKRVFIDWYNRRLQLSGSQMSPCRSLGAERTARLNALIQHYGKETVFEGIRRAMSSDFLNGRGKYRFVAGLDWILQPDHFSRIIEGFYDQLYQPESTIKYLDYNGVYERMRCFPHPSYGRVILNGKPAYALVNDLRAAGIPFETYDFDACQWVSQ